MNWLKTLIVFHVGIFLIAGTWMLFEDGGMASAIIVCFIGSLIYGKETHR